MKCFKWLFDRVVAFFGLLFLWPIFILIAILVKCKMGGPVIFKQQRVGKGGVNFTCHKFRTMTQSHGGHSVTISGESRITPLGVKLRKYKLDELPGLWDVFIGKMSFVGPRPDVPGYADKLEGDDRDVLKMLPGITGPATLKYRNEEELIASFVRDVRSGSSALNRELIDVEFNKMTDEQVALWYNDNVIYPDKVRLNCYYYRNYSFIKDIQIIVVTILKRKIRYADEII